MSSKRVDVAVVGLGTIGTGVAKLLLHKEAANMRHAGCGLRMRYGVDLDVKRDRGVDFPDGVLTDDLDRVLADDDVEIVVQLIGGTGAARSIMLKVLDAGKHVVTANKALLAAYGAELFQRARERGCTISFEAAVAGGIPIVASICESLTANKINSVGGILNGTCNFIITEMQEHGSDYSEVLSKAQDLGYAEADPTLDVNGSDTAQKLAILAQLAFGLHVDWESIPRMGVDELAIQDIQMADALGFRIKLLATALGGNQGPILSVSPTLISKDEPLASVSGAFNAVQIVGDAVGPVFYQGYGAGEMPTASAVVSDVIATACGRAAVTFDRMSLWPAGEEKVSAPSIEGASSCWFVRASAGVTAESLAEWLRIDVSNVEADDDGVGAISASCNRRELQDMLGTLGDNLTILPVLLSA